MAGGLAFLRFLAPFTLAGGRLRLLGRRPGLFDGPFFGYLGRLLRLHPELSGLMGSLSHRL
ncbi:MAG: hypothetical protein PVG33_13675 [Chloroflexota bacterium]